MCIPPNTDTSDMEQWEKDLMIVDFCFVLIFTMESIAYTIAIGQFGLLVWAVAVSVNSFAFVQQISARQNILTGWHLRFKPYAQLDPLGLMAVITSWIEFLFRDISLGFTGFRALR